MAARLPAGQRNGLRSWAAIGRANAAAKNERRLIMGRCSSPRCSALTRRFGPIFHRFRSQDNRRFCSGMAVRSLFAVLCSFSLLFHRHRALISLRCRDATRGPTGRFRVASLQKPVPQLGSSVSRLVPRRRFALCSVVCELVKPAHKALHRSIEHPAYSQQSPNRDRPPSLHLLPMPGREPKGDHILLAVAVVHAKPADTAAERPEEFCLIYHSPVCKVLRAK